MSACVATTAGERRLGSDDGDGRTAKIRTLNDAFRCGIPRTGGNTRLILTDGVGSLPPAQLASIVGLVRTFAEFTPDNDPHGEHDFGAVEHDSVRYFWKIDAYDRWMQFGSPDPTDPTVTTRVLTIMRADEY